MATSDINLAERSGSLVESHKGYDPRIILFYFLIAALLLTLAGGLAYQQLIKHRRPEVPSMGVMRPRHVRAGNKPDRPSAAGREPRDYAHNHLGTEARVGQ